MENILVVEDEANILKLVSINLFSRGYQVSEAKNATEALAQLHLKLPSLMILDIKLPDFNGWELLNQMKHDPLIESNFPVLIMTASITDAYVDMKSNPSVVDVLIKPFSSVKLISAVQRAITQHP
ncbi:MAG: response regulator [Anaerolineaceae bacterium]|nr:response regulator [Anaerolineaceae bacterium]